MSQVVQANQRVDERLKSLETHAKAGELQIGGRRRREGSSQLGSFQPRMDAIGVRIRRYNAACRPDCACMCHRPSRSSTPGFLNSLLGQLFINYSQFLMFRSGCDSQQCSKPSTPCIELEYWFPRGVFWSQILRVHYAYQAHLGPQFQLSTLRRIPGDAPANLFVLAGNVEKMQDLFSRGLASPCDVSETRGYSLLRVSRDALLIVICADDVLQVGLVRHSIRHGKISHSCRCGSSLWVSDMRSLSRGSRIVD
jgi:hypothetical protein